MKILRKGKELPGPQRIKLGCKDCYAVFEAERSEFLGFMGTEFIECPNCKETVYETEESKKLAVDLLEFGN